MKALLSLLMLFLHLTIGCNQETATRTEPQTSPSPIRNDSKISLEELGAAMTAQYKRTPWEVSVFGDSATNSLAFDCSGDPHPEDTCFMLYKRYPDKAELKILRMMGVQRLFFRAGFLGKSWEKDL